MINCSEKCIHAEDGICTLKVAGPPSSTPTKDCPYYTGLKDKNETDSLK